MKNVLLNFLTKFVNFSLQFAGILGLNFFMVLLYTFIMVYNLSYIDPIQSWLLF